MEVSIVGSYFLDQLPNENKLMNDDTCRVWEREAWNWKRIERRESREESV